VSPRVNFLKQNSVLEFALNLSTESAHAFRLNTSALFSAMDAVSCIIFFRGDFFRTFRQLFLLHPRVARWHSFKPKIPILIYFWGPWNGKCVYILRPLGIFSFSTCYGHLEILVCFSVLVCCAKKNLATLLQPSRSFINVFIFLACPTFPTRLRRS
jgi:thiol-disulfide isomerase/thioredoxin